MPFRDLVEDDRELALLLRELRGRLEGTGRTARRSGGAMIHAAPRACVLRAVIARLPTSRDARRRGTPPFDAGRSAEIRLPLGQGTRRGGQPPTSPW